MRLFWNFLLLCLVGLMTHLSQAVDPKKGNIPLSPGSSSNILHYEIFGKNNASPIVVLHGGPGFNFRYIQPFVTRLADHFQIIFYDQRGSGDSTYFPLNVTTINVQTFVEDLEKLRNHLGFKKWAVLGHSWGGMLAMQYALRHPEHIEKLILVSSVPSTKKNYDDYTKKMPDRKRVYQDELKNIESLKAKDPDGYTRRYYQAIFKPGFYDPQKSYLLPVQTNPAFSVGQIYNLMTETLYSHPFDLNQALRKLRIPTLLIHGEDDFIPIRFAQEIADNIEGSVFHRIAQCGHFPFIEKTEDFLIIVQHFMREGTKK